MYMLTTVRPTEKVVFVALVVCGIPCQCYFRISTLLNEHRRTCAAWLPESVQSAVTIMDRAIFSVTAELEMTEPTYVHIQNGNIYYKKVLLDIQ